MPPFHYVRLSELLIIYCGQALYTKAFFILGLLWSFEGIHAILIRDGPDFQNPILDYFFLTVDILNLLRGVFMFLIFVCKKTVWLKARKWWRERKRTRESRRSSRTNAKQSITSVKTLNTTML